MVTMTSLPATQAIHALHRALPCFQSNQKHFTSLLQTYPGAFVISTRLYEICKLRRLLYLPSGPLGVWGSLTGSHTDAQNEFEDENYCLGEKNSWCSRIFKGKKFPMWVCQGLAMEKVMFSKMRVTTQVNSQSGGGRRERESALGWHSYSGR